MVAENFPLSPAQQRIWFLQRLDPDSTVFNGGRAFRLKGHLDCLALEEALRAIIRRHEILRTGYDTAGDVPVQKLLADWDFSLDRIDLRHLEGAEQDRALTRLLQQRLDRPFDLGSEVQLRAAVIHIRADEYVFTYETHHVASDYWSGTILLQELNTLYGAFIQGVPDPLPPLPLQYREVAARLVSPEKLREDEADLAYWRTRLTSLESLALPSDAPRPAVQTTHGAAVRGVLSPELVGALRRIGARGRSTLFMVLLATFKILLHRQTGQDDLTVGAPVAVRDRAEVEPLIGIFLNSVVLRTRLPEEKQTVCFQDLLDAVRQTALEAFEHQNLPFERLLDELKPARDRSRTPLFNVFFNMIHLPAPDPLLPGLESSVFDYTQEKANFDLTVYVRPDPGGFEVKFVYNADIYRAERMQALHAQYLQLLAQVAGGDNIPIHAYDLVLPGEARPERMARRPPPAAFLGPIHERLAHHAARTPDAPAVIGPDAVWSYRQLENLSGRIASTLAGLGIRKGHRVVLLAERSAALVPAVFGILKAGAVLTLLDPGHPAARLAETAALLRPDAFLHLPPIPPGLEAALGRSLRVPPVDLAGFSTADPNEPFRTSPVELTADDPAIISFTSGSTGIPKGVICRHGPLTHFMPWQEERFALNPADRFSVLSGLSHDPLQRDLFTAIWAGAAVCIPSQTEIENPGALGAWAAEKRITFMHLTPAMGQLLTETAGSVRLPDLRWAFFIGDVLTRRDVDRLRALAPETGVINAYGATETQRAVSWHILEPGAPIDEAGAVLHLGRGSPDVDLLVLNREGRLCGIGELGEIFIRSAHLAAGYLKDPELTDARFVEASLRSDGSMALIPARNPSSPARMYRSGDLGRFRFDGSVEYAGRADRQVQIRGLRVEPAEIEAALLEHPGLQDAVVLFHDDLPTGPGLVAYLVPLDTQNGAGGNHWPAEARKFLAGRLPRAMVPAAFVPLARIPLTPNGKIDRGALPVPDLSPSAFPASVSPADGVEARLVRILRSVLNTPNVTRESDFFDLGGHSLLAIRLFGEIEKAFSVRLPLSTLFQVPTAAGLAELVRGEREADRGILVPIRTGGGQRPLFLVHGFGGGVVGYAELARQLGLPEVPLYGLRAEGLDGFGSPVGDLEAMARGYVDEIRGIQPRGPYRLGGYCYGGVVAYEIARQLEASGERAELLAVMEGYAPLRGSSRETAWQNPRLVIHFLQNAVFWWRDFLRLGSRGMRLRIRRRLGRTWAALQRRMGREPGINLRNIIDEDFDLVPEVNRRLMETHIRALMAYVPEPIDGRLTLYRVRGRSLSRTPDPHNGWLRLARGGVDVHIISGQHDNILEPAHAAALAAALRSAIEKLDGDG